MNARSAHSGFARLIWRTRSRISPATRGRPPRPRDFHRQYKRKPRRCQRITVAGLMIVTASRIEGSTRYRQTNSSRSAFVSRARFGTLRRSTVSWCRRTRFSPSSRARDLNRDPAECHTIVRNSIIGRNSTRSAAVGHAGWSFRQAHPEGLEPQPAQGGADLEFPIVTRHEKECR